MNEAPENTPKPASLHAKLAEVMAEVGRIPKRGRNDFHKYDYATEADIVESVRGALSSRSVSLVPSVRHVVREGTLTTVLMTFTFTDGATGETTAHDWAGTGDDKGDKGLYKAMTGALKYFLLKTFLLPTGDDPEDDDATDRRAYGEKRKPRGEPAVPAALKCTRCGEAALVGGGLCATCQRLLDERRADDAARAAKGSASSPVEKVQPTTEKPPASSPRKHTPATIARMRAFALMDKYGVPNDAAHRPDRLAIYGKALELGRLATEDEARSFTAAQWTSVCEWLVKNNEPPPEDEAPLAASYDEAT